MSKSEWLEYLKTLKKLKENSIYGIHTTYNINPHRSGNDSLGVNYGGRHDWWVPDYDPTPPKRKHEFSPILLVFSTVYDCKYCKRRKEDCKSDYCESEDTPPDLNFGDWG